MKPNRHPLCQLTPTQAENAKQEARNIIGTLGETKDLTTVATQTGKAIALIEGVGIHSLAEELTSHSRILESTGKETANHVERRVKGLYAELCRIYKDQP